MSKQCENCQKSNPADAKFCLACGSKFREDSKAYDAFISYRRETGSHIATAIQVMLESQYKKHIFLDVRELQIGRFDEELLTRIEQTPSFILILSRGCLDRCAEKSDWLKREVVHALEHKRNIIPVIMEDFTYPNEEKLALLPDAMRVLPNLQAVAYSHVHQESAIRRIAESLSRGGGKQARKPTRSEVAQPQPDSASTQNTLQPRDKATIAQIPTPPATSIGVGTGFNLQLLRDPNLPRSAFLFTNDGVVTEVPIDQKILQSLQFKDNANLPRAEITTIEILKARSGEPVRVRMTRNDGSLHEGDLQGHIWDVNKGEPCLWWGDMISMPFRKMNRIEFGSLHSNHQHFDNVATWGKAEMSGIAFSPDGSLLAAAARGGPLLFGIPDLDPLPFTDLMVPGPNGIECPYGSSSMSISSDGSLVVSQEWEWVIGQGWSKILRMRHLPDGSLASEIRDGAIKGRFSPTASLLAVVDGPPAAAVKIYSANDGNLLHTLKGHTGEITSLAFSPDGRHLASASRDKTIRVWNVDNGKCAQTLRDSPNALGAVAWSPNSCLFAGLTWNSLMVWSCSDWKRKLELRLPFSLGRTGIASALACHPSKPWIAIADHQGIVTWNWETGLFDSVWEQESRVIDVAFSRDGFLATASEDGCLNLWQPA